MYVISWYYDFDFNRNMHIVKVKWNGHHLNLLHLDGMQLSSHQVVNLLTYPLYQGIEVSYL